MPFPVTPTATVCVPSTKLTVPVLPAPPVSSSSSPLIVNVAVAKPTVSVVLPTISVALSPKSGSIATSADAVKLLPDASDTASAALTVPSAQPDRSAV